MDDDNDIAYQIAKGTLRRGVKAGAKGKTVRKNMHPLGPLPPAPPDNGAHEPRKTPNIKPGYTLK